MHLARRDLGGRWTLSCLGPGAPAGLPDRIPATVPGCVHTDLLAAGLIPDPYLGTNELALDWIGHCNWLYSLEFDWDGAPADRHDLVCLGLDTVAHVSLNGDEIAATANMHRTYRFDVGAHLKSGANRLEIRFDDAWQYGDGIRQQIGDRPNSYPSPSNMLRKMACNFGWDWGPTVVTAGIWRPIAIESWSGARLASVRPSVTVEGATGQVRIAVDVERAGQADDLTLTATVAGLTATALIAPGATSATLSLDVPDPQLWWPAGLGAQPLYDLDVTLAANAAPRDTWHKRIGFRALRLDTSPDTVGSAFTFVVNNVPVFITGANWIPDDCFPSRITRERYARRIAQSRDANINMLRVWGGGIYEDDAFYEICDEMGVLVWQDFLFACATYPEEEPLWSEVEAEARDNVVRLMPHPSLALWNGNNENIWGYFDWNWKAPLAGRTWGQGYYLDLLPRVCAELDPARPYWPGSPYSGAMDIHPNADHHGCRHIWDVWNEVGYEIYRNYVPRFASEFGFQAPPAWATLTRAVHDDPLTFDSPGVLHHQKAANGNLKLARGLAGHLPAPRNTDDWHYLTQVNQARAIALGVEHMRSHRPTCMGAIVWQINDCWPVTSWAAIDGDGRRKPLWYALRRIYAQRLLTIQPRTEGLTLFAIDENALAWRGIFTARRMHIDGRVLAEATGRLVADRFSKAEALLPPEITTPEDPAREFITANFHLARALWFFNEDVDVVWPAPDADVSVSGVGRDWLVEVRARTLLRDLCLFVDRIHPDAEVDEMLVTLLPGETQRFRVTSPVPITVEAISRPPVFRCINQTMPR